VLTIRRLQAPRSPLRARCPRQVSAVTAICPLGGGAGGTRKPGRLVGAAGGFRVPPCVFDLEVDLDLVFDFGWWSGVADNYDRMVVTGAVGAVFGRC